MSKIPKKYELFVFTFCTALLMSFLMSGVMTMVNLGLTEHAFTNWLTRAFPVGFIIALPIALFVVPLVRRFVTHITA